MRTAIFAVLLVIVGACAIDPPSPLRPQDEAFAALAIGVEVVTPKLVEMRQRGLIGDETWTGKVKPALKAARASLVAAEAALGVSDLPAADRALAAVRGALAIAQSVLVESTP